MLYQGGLLPYSRRTVHIGTFFLLEPGQGKILEMQCSGPRPPIKRFIDLYFLLSMKLCGQRIGSGATSTAADAMRRDGVKLTLMQIAMEEDGANFKRERWMALRQNAKSRSPQED